MLPSRLVPPPAPMSISLVVCTVDRLEPLERLLASLRRQSHPPLEILVVDQNPAGVVAPLMARFRDLPLVHLVTTRGLSKARNIGLRVARGELVGFPDDDCWYDEDTLARACGFFSSGERVDLLAGRTVDASGVESVSHHLPRSAPITRANVFLAGNTNGLFVCRALADRVGGFDEELGVGASTPFQSGEETDFILRCLAEGGVGRFEHGLVIRHDRKDEDPATSARRAARYAPGFGRVLRLHGFAPHVLGDRVARAMMRGAAYLVTGRVHDAHQRYAWAAGAARGYAAPLPGARAATRRGGSATVFGLRFTPLDQGALAERLTAEAIPRGAGPRVIATANLDHIVQRSRNAAFREAYTRSWAVTADGMPVYLYARLRGADVAGRLTGADLFVRLMKTLSPDTHRCFFVASSPRTAQRLESALLARGFPSGSLAFCVPPLGFEADAQYSQALADRVRAHEATHLFLGVGAPKSEIWTDRHRGAIGDCYVLNVGAALDFFAGTKRRAPALLQRTGLEWAWRVASEPRRLFRRYFVDSWHFLGLVGADLLGHRAAPGGERREARAERDV